MFRSIGVRFSCWLLIVCGIAVAGDPEPAATAGPPSEVTVAKPVVRKVTDYENFTGRAAAVQTVEVRPRVTGQLDKICFKAGEAVKQGDLLAEIDSRPYLADAEKAEADARLGEARLKLADANLKMGEQRVAAAAISHDEFNRMKMERLTAEAALQSARANLVAAKLRLDFTKITAPISGRIGRTTVDAGNFVAADTTALATIVSTGPVYVYIDMDERTVLKLRRKALANAKEMDKSGLPVACGLPDETDYPRHGVLDYASNQVSPATGTLVMRALLPNADGLVMPGMFIRVRMTMGEPYKALLVPQRALHEIINANAKGSPYNLVPTVFVLTAANVAQWREVKLGPARDDGMRIVMEGLTADDKIIVSDVKLLSNGTKVKVKPAESPAAAQPVAPAPHDKSPRP